MPILNSTLIIIVSFVPLFFLSGMEGRMLVPLGVAFIVSLFASTIVALTLTPVLCSYLLGHKAKTGGLPKEAFLAVYLKKHYQNGLSWALSHKKIVLGTTLTLFVAALGSFLTLGRSFLPPFNEGSFTINISSFRVSPWRNRIKSDGKPKNCCSPSPKSRPWHARRDGRNWTSMPSA